MLVPQASDLPPSSFLAQACLVVLLHTMGKHIKHNNSAFQRMLCCDPAEVDLMQGGSKAQCEQHMSCTGNAF